MNRSNYTKKKRRKQRGGGYMKRISIMVMMMAMIYMYLISKEPQIQLIDVGPDKLIKPKDIGLSLVPYNKNVKNAINNFLNTETGYNRVKVQLDDSLRIVDIQNKLNPYIDRSSDADTRAFRVNTDYSKRQLSDEYRDNWYDKSISQTQSDSIETILQYFMPPIVEMSGQIPKDIYLGGSSAEPRRTWITQSNVHQDIDVFAIVGPTTMDHDYRIMLIQDTGDTELTEFVTKVNNQKATRYLNDIPFFHNELEVVNLKIENADYAAIIFDNFKIFHRTPNIDLVEYFQGLVPDRYVTQIRIQWNDKDQMDYPTDDEIDYDRSFEEMVGGRRHRRN